MSNNNYYSSLLLAKTIRYLSKTSLILDNNNFVNLNILNYGFLMYYLHHTHPCMSAGTLPRSFHRRSLTLFRTTGSLT